MAIQTERKIPVWDYLEWEERQEFKHEYIDGGIIDEDRVRADYYTRAEEGWYIRVFNQPEDVIPLPMLNCELPLAQVYLGIVFDEAKSLSLTGPTSNRDGANRR